jgi:hypothetical protein
MPPTDLAAPDDDRPALEALAIDTAANELLLVSLLRALAEQAPDLYAGVIKQANAEVSRRKVEEGEGAWQRRLTDAVCGVMGAVERYVSAIRSIAVR